MQADVTNANVAEFAAKCQALLTDIKAALGLSYFTKGHDVEFVELVPDGWEGRADRDDFLRRHALLSGHCHGERHRGTEGRRWNILRDPEARNGRSRPPVGVGFSGVDELGSALR